MRIPGMLRERYPALVRMSPPGSAPHCDFAAEPCRHRVCTRLGSNQLPYLETHTMLTRREATALLVGGVAAALLPRVFAADDKKKFGPDPKQWDMIVEKAIAYLKKEQGADGSWSSKESPGVTGIVLTGALETGKVGAKDPMVEKGLKYIESLINPKAGHIAGKDPKVQLQNYVTCINVMALTEANRDSYKAVVKDAAKFLKGLQWDDSKGKGP